MMYDHSGVYINVSTQGDQTLLVVEREAWKDLCSGFSYPCSCLAIHVGALWIEWNSVMQVRACMWAINALNHYFVSFMIYCQCRHVLRALFQCSACQRQRKYWASSRIFGGHCLVNQKWAKSALPLCTSAVFRRGWHNEGWSPLLSDVCPPLHFRFIVWLTCAQYARKASPLK